jgi:quinol monooxygenase YgiN
MLTTLVEYTIKTGEEDTVLAAINTFVTAIHKHEPETFYEAYRKGDSLHFVHLMKFPDATAEHKHQHAAYTLAFVEALYPRCEVDPHFTDVIRIE